MAWQETLAWPRLVLFMVVVFVLMTTVMNFVSKNEPLDLDAHDQELGKPRWCPLPPPMAEAVDGMMSSDIFSNASFVKRQVDRLGDAVRVPSISFDDNGDVDSDPRWDVFTSLHEVLEKHFPKVHGKMQLEKINRLGLLYTLQGSSAELKPIIFMAHQDVVPVSNPSTWTHPPFEAHYDGTWLWGRGTVDCKNNLIGLLSAAEELLEQGFVNKRTIIFSFGFDEETGGERGGKHLAARLHEKIGTDGADMILDEGGMGIEKIGSVVYARPATAEKGYVDLVMDLETPGGHSSRPPSHTGIGIMARLVEALEDNAFKPHLDDANPFRNFLECEAQYSPEDVEPWLEEGLLSGKDLGDAIVKSRGEQVRWSIQTSQAVDVIRGGEKDNVLPTHVQTVINYRVLPTEDMDEMFKRIADSLASVAHSFNISVEGLGYSEHDSGLGLLNLTTKDRLSPSPITPTGPDVAIWNSFSATIRQVFEETTGPSGQGLVVPVGDIMTGNTDTAHYWDISKNIYRFSPRWEGSFEGVHSSDERIMMQTHMDGIRMYYELIRNLNG